MSLSGFSKQSHIAIIGFGIEGQSTLKYLYKHGYTNICVCDFQEDLVEQLLKKRNQVEENLGTEENNDLLMMRHEDRKYDQPLEPLDEDLLKAIENVQWQLGESYLDDLTEFEFIFRSPGINPKMIELYDAKLEGCQITSATELFFANCKGMTVGVTGTKGKGTTSTLIYEILKNSGRDVYLGGNIGRCALDFLDDLNDWSISVLELSSFQLQDLDYSPNIAVVLNTTLEHLDYHSNQEEYWEAKAMIVRNQGKNDTLVINKDYPYSGYFAALTNANKRFVSRKTNLEKNQIGAFMQEDAVVNQVADGSLKAICKKAELRLLGEHNLENVLPAVVVADLCDVHISDTKKVLMKFSGLPHRLEHVGELDGVSYVNDSFSTTPETCMAAIQAFSSPIVLLIGGSSKNADFTDLAQTILKNHHVKALILLGDDEALTIAEALEVENQKMTENKRILLKNGTIQQSEGIPLRMIYTQNFGEAFLATRMVSDAGDVALMSPACASFNWFRNYKQRGNTFRGFVQAHQ